MRSWTSNELPRVLSTARAEELGVTRAERRTELSRHNWRLLARGIILTRPDEPTRYDWMRAGMIAAGASGAVTGWDAARLHGVGDRRPPTPLIHIATRSGGARTIGRVRITPTTRPYDRLRIPSDDGDLGGLRYVPAARAVVDTALSERRLDRVQALVTGAVQKRRASVLELTAEAGVAPRRQSRLLRAAMADVIGGARSAAEATALGKLRRAAIPDYELNVPVVVGGVTVAVVDILVRALRLVIEIDSREFHFAEADWLDTLARHGKLTTLGLAVHHHAPSVVGRPGWIGEVEGLLRARAAELGQPYVVGGLLPSRPYLVRPR